MGLQSLRSQKIKQCGDAQRKKLEDDAEGLSRAHELGLPTGWRAKFDRSGKASTVYRFFSPAGSEVRSLKKLEETLGTLPAPLQSLRPQKNTMMRNTVLNS